MTMMAFCYTFIYVLAIVCMKASSVGSKGNINRIEIKALISRYNCDVNQLLQAFGGNSTVWCAKVQNVGRYFASNKTLCQVTRNETVFQYHCVEGTWKQSKGTDYHLRFKREFLTLLFIVGAIVGAIITTTILYCFIKHGSIKCKEEVKGSDEQLKAPTYTVCPPPDIQTLYIAGRRQKTVHVTWTDPVATDDREVISNVQTHGVKKGEQFEGLPNEGYPHNIIYTAKDGHGLTDTCAFKFYVKYLTCSAPPTPENGRKVSCPDDNIYGGECTFECNNGYEMSGSSMATCQQDEKWDNSPTCEKIRCDPPFNITNGIVTCDSTRYEFEDNCIFSCNDGFQLDGPLEMICLANKRWSSDSLEFRCVDDDPPVISCKSPQVFYADRGSFNTSVTWVIPTATDNVDSNPSVFQTSGPYQGEILTEGFHSVKYKTNDSTGNSFPALSECTIVIDVKVIKCSTGPTDALDNARFIMPNCSDMSYFYGVSCTLNCDLNLPLNGTNLLTCERDGSTDKGVWMWGSGDQPFCEVVKCPHIDPPRNGSLTTDSVNARPLHVMSCRSGLDIPSVGSQFVGRLSCQDSGSWYPLDAFPDCIISKIPWLNLPFELYYNGDCNDDVTKTRIKENVLVYLHGVEADIDNSICPNVDTCKLEFLDVECGESRRKRKSSGSHIIHKRNDFTLIKLAVMKKWEQRDRSVHDSYINISADLNSIADKVEQDAYDGIILNVTGLILPDDGVQRGNPTLFCDPGYKVDTGSLTCKPCPPGTYLDSDTNNCEFCKIGEYMDHAGASQCDLCPKGYSTLATGAKERNKCLKLCNPGFFSSTSMEPCSACPVGSYQSAKGQSSCHSCPDGKATSKTNSVSVDDCNFFDVFVNSISQRTDIWSFTANQTSDLTMSVWLKVQDETNEDMSISISDSDGDIVNLHVANEISIQAGTGTFILTNTRVSSKVWTHIICEVDIASGTLQLYVGESAVVNETDIALDTSRRLSAGNVKLAVNSKGLYVSGLVIYGHILSQNEKTSLSKTCSGTSKDKIFTMTGILSNIVDGIAITIPSTCNPIDECSRKPCGNHTCINMVNKFSCICHGGMSGDVCDIPPDYCLNNRCVQGVCQPGNRSYTCNCNDGYIGEFCDVPIENGGWSQWGDWSKCDVTCNSGLTFRRRKCDNPIPSPDGRDCEGESLESVTCNDLACPTCSLLRRKYGTIVYCYNVSDTLQKCNVTCLPGRTLTSGQASFVEYTCGDSTNHEWLPIDKIPDCVEVHRPDFFGTQATVSYNQSIKRSAQTGVITEVENNLSGVNCISNGACTVTTTVSSDNQSHKRIESSTKLTIQVSIKLTDTADLDLAGYLSNGTETSSMTELLGALNSINEVIGFIDNNTEEIFQVNVEGVEYAIKNTSPVFVATVTCPSGYAGADGLCAQCPVGTYLVDFQCIDCEVGTYQPLIGQSECLSCPSGYTTATYGSSDASECSVLVEENYKTDSHDDDYDSNDDKNNDEADKERSKGKSSMIFL